MDSGSLVDKSSLPQSDMKFTEAFLQQEDIFPFEMFCGKGNFIAIPLPSDRCGVNDGTFGQLGKRDAHIGVLGGGAGGIDQAFPTTILSVLGVPETPSGE